ncbi:MAG: type II toxin-antitoxin system RelE/ParE family toxin [Candidatus Berkelbacteria bacterium]|nr:type II toxin-antitoxin system RelE/ParE family toxin [Candidatus Berkelbacteria bacterium]
MSWELFFLETGRARKPVEEFIYSLDGNTAGKVFRMLDLLKEHGPTLRMPYSKKISSNLFELRIRGRIEVRIFHTLKNNLIYPLHAFVKKTQSTPHRELDTAEKALKLLV